MRAVAARVLCRTTTKRTTTTSSFFSTMSTTVARTVPSIMPSLVPISSSSSFCHYDNVSWSQLMPTSTCSSTTRRHFSSLSDILVREHEEELENEASSIMPPDLEKLQKQLEQDWKIVSDGAMTKLYRTIPSNENKGPCKIQISFHCQDTVDIFPATERGMEGEYDDDDDDDEDELLEEEDAGPVRFTVTVSRTGKVLVLTCLSEDAMARIQGITVTTSEDVESIHGTSKRSSGSAGGGGGGVDAYQYQGPEFDELAEDLQNAFHTYLEEQVGVSEDVASFISMYSDYREQVEYVKFLEDAKSIVQ